MARYPTRATRDGKSLPGTCRSAAQRGIQQGHREIDVNGSVGMAAVLGVSGPRGSRVVKTFLWFSQSVLALVAVHLLPVVVSTSTRPTGYLDHC
jgi:hypothetical protein